MTDRIVSSICQTANEVLNDESMNHDQAKVSVTSLNNLAKKLFMQDVINSEEYKKIEVYLKNSIYSFLRKQS